MTPFNKAAWYWRVGGDQSQVYSSVAGGYVPLADAGYQAWVAAGGVPSTIANADELAAVLRRELPKSTVMGRVFGLGFTAQIAQLFGANFELQAKWNSPDWPNVYCDDPGLLLALNVIGMSAAQIAQVVAP